MENHLKKAYEKASTLNDIMNRVPDDLLCKLSPKEIILLTEVIHVAFNAGADRASEISEGPTLTETIKVLRERVAQLGEEVGRLIKAAPSSEFENGVLKEMRKHLEQIIANELDAMRTSPCSSE